MVDWRGEDKIRNVKRSYQISPAGRSRLQQKHKRLIYCASDNCSTPLAHGWKWKFCSYCMKRQGVGHG